ncbi:MAG: hypothetical protein ONB30_06055 [candidate division KSB1 bacterium]|nr:hypothetical protein [candidate division KSB1 bacterium]
MKKAVLICTCSFACPSMKDISFGELTERIRLELPQDYVVLHPRICEANGENLMEDLLKPGVKYITLACKEEKQRKLLRDGFQRAGVPMDENWHPISISFKTTEQALAELTKALEEEK